MFDPGDLAPEDLEILLPIFRTSGEVRIAELRASLRALGGAPDDEEALTQLHRSAHSLKGAALQLGFERIGTVARAMEALASAARRHPDGMPADAVELLARCTDWLEPRLREAGTGDAAPEGAEALLQALGESTARLEMRAGAA